MLSERRVVLWFTRGPQRGRKNPHTPDRALPLFSSTSVSTISTPTRTRPSRHAERLQQQNVSSPQEVDCAVATAADDAKRSRWYKRVLAGNSGMSPTTFVSFPAPAAVVTTPAVQKQRRFSNEPASVTAQVQAFQVAPNEALGGALRRLPWVEALHLFRGVIPTSNHSGASARSTKSLAWLASQMCSNPSVAADCPAEKLGELCLAPCVLQRSTSDTEDDDARRERDDLVTMTSQLLVCAAAQHRLVAMWLRIVKATDNGAGLSLNTKGLLFEARDAVTSVPIMATPLRVLLTQIHAISTSSQPGAWAWSSTARRASLLQIRTTLTSSPISIDVHLMSLVLGEVPQEPPTRDVTDYVTLVPDVVVAPGDLNTIGGIYTLAVAAMIDDTTGDCCPVTSSALIRCIAHVLKTAQHSDVLLMWVAHVLEAAVHVVTNTSGSATVPTNAATMATLSDDVARLVIAVMDEVSASRLETVVVAPMLHGALGRALSMLACHMHPVPLRRVAETFLQRLPSSKAQRLPDVEYMELIVHFFFAVAQWQRPNDGSPLPQVALYVKKLVPLLTEVANADRKVAPLLIEAQAAHDFLHPSVASKRAHTRANVASSAPTSPSFAGASLSAMMVTFASKPSSVAKRELLQAWDQCRVSPMDLDINNSGHHNTSGLILQHLGVNKVCMLIQELLRELAPRSTTSDSNVHPRESHIAAEIIEQLIQRSISVHHGGPPWSPSLSAIVLQMVSLPASPSPSSVSVAIQCIAYVVELLARFMRRAGDEQQSMQNVILEELCCAVLSAAQPPHTLQPWEALLQCVARCFGDDWTLQLLHRLGDRAPTWLLMSALRSIAAPTLSHPWQVDVAFSLPRDAGATKSANVLYPCVVDGSRSHRVSQRFDVASNFHLPTSIPSTQWVTAAALLNASMNQQRKPGVDRRASLLLVRRSATAVLRSLIESDHSPTEVLERLTLRLAREFGVFPDVPPPHQVPVIVQTPGHGTAAPLDDLTHLVLQQRGCWSAQAWQRAIVLLQQQHCGTRRAWHESAATTSLHAEVLRRVSTASWYGAAVVCSTLLSNVSRASVPQPSPPLTFSLSTALTMFEQFGRAGAWMCALTLASTLQAHPKISPRAWPSETAYTSCLTACRVAHKWEASLNVFDDLFRRTHLVGASVEEVEGAAPHARRQIAMQFAHVAEFVAALISPRSPVTAVQVCLQRFQQQPHPVGGAAASLASSPVSPHLRALFQLLGHAPAAAAAADVGAAPPPPTMAALEVFMATLDASNSNRAINPSLAGPQDPSTHIWQTALAVFSDALQQPLLAQDDGDTHAFSSALHNNISTVVQVPTQRVVLSLLSILRRSSRWEETLRLYNMTKRLDSVILKRGHHSGGGVPPPSDQRRRGDDADGTVLYQTVATLAAHAGAWRSSVTLLQEELTRRRSTKHRGVRGAAVSPRVLDRVVHGVLCCSSPTAWRLALTLVAANSSHTAPPPTLLMESISSHAAELLVQSADVPLEVRVRCFETLVERRVLPVAFTHKAASHVLSLAHSLINHSHHVSAFPSSSTAARWNGLRVLRIGIRNVDTRVAQLYDTSASSRPTTSTTRAVPREEQLRFLRCYYEAMACQWASSPQQLDPPTDAFTAKVAIGRLIDIWQEQRLLTRSGASVPIPHISVHVLESVATVLRDVVGDAERASHITAWVASSSSTLN